jgi:hypothetical protein
MPERRTAAIRTGSESSRPLPPSHADVLGNLRERVTAAGIGPAPSLPSHRRQRSAQIQIGD